MIDLEVCNFQSIQQAKVRIDGFTVVLGSSDIGKSAFVRAVKYALTNAPGTGFVRHGLQCDRIVKGTKKCKCSSKVVIGTPEAEITWEKGDSVNCYLVLDRVSGEICKYEGLDRGTPSFLTGFQRVQVGTSQELIQIPKQFEPIFLLNESGGVVADVLSDLAHLGKLNEASGLVSSDRKEAATKRKLREEDRNKLREALSGFDGLDSIEVGDLTSALEGVDEASALLTSVTRYHDSITRLDSDHERLKGVEEKELPTATSVVSLFKQMSLVESSRLKLERLQDSLESLESKTPGELLETSVLETLSQEYLQMSRLQIGIVTVVQAYKQLTNIEMLSLPSAKDLADLYRSFDQMGRLGLAYETTLNWWSRADLVESAEIPECSSIEELLKQVKVLDSYTQRLQQLNPALAKAQADFDTAVSEETRVLQELNALGVCPVCSQPLASGHSVHLGAA